MARHYIIDVVLLCLIPIATIANAKPNPVHASISTPNDSLKVKGSVSVTGLFQTGNENRTVISLLSSMVISKRPFELEPLTSVAYSTKPGKQVEGEYLENLILRAGPSHLIYPAFGTSIEHSFLRKIEYRYNFAAIVVFNVVNTDQQHLKIGGGYSDEYEQYEKGAFLFDKNISFNKRTDQIYLRLKGKNDLIGGRVILIYDIFYQTAWRDIEDYHWTMILNSDFMLSKHFAVRASAISSYENFVAKEVSKYNFRLTFGLNYSF